MRFTQGMDGNGVAGMTIVMTWIIPSFPTKHQQGCNEIYGKFRLTHLIRVSTKDMWKTQGFLGNVVDFVNLCLFTRK